MYATGFLQEQRRSPVSLAAVVGLHATAFALLVLYGTTTFQREEENRLTAINIKQPPPPPVNPPPPPPAPRTPQQVSTPTVTQKVLPPVTTTFVAPVTPQTTYQPPQTQTGPRVVLAEATIPRIPEPVRRGAEVDPRFRDALQPPYPPDRERAQDEGQVRVRITIGTDGRVTAIERVGSGAHDSFWRFTQRQALNRWRFRPATVDGRPIVSTMVFTVTFRLPEA